MTLSNQHEAASPGWPNRRPKDHYRWSTEGCTQLAEEYHVDIDRNAPVITQDEIVIAARLNTAWNLLTDIAAWPDWQHEIDRASLDTPLGVGTIFHWSRAGLAITSTVAELIPHERITWSGPVEGIMGRAIASKFSAAT
jgi:hypothetical protein